MAFQRKPKKPESVKRNKYRVDRYRVLADARYGDELLGRLINKVMVSGKKSTAESIVYEALDNIKPAVEVKSRRVGGSTYQVPIEVSPHRRLSLGIRWLVGYARSRGERHMRDKLASEILDALQNRGGAVKKREDTYAMAEANKAFAHFRW